MNNISLLDWQREGMRKWVLNKGSGIIQAPTGTGKTFLGLKLISRDNLSPFMVIVPTVELKEQWKERVKKYYPDTIITGVGGGEKYKYNNTLFDSKEVIIAVINSVRNSQFKMKTVILDEIHHYTQYARTNYQIWNNIQYKYVMGLSATPIPDRLTEVDLGWNIPLVYTYTIPNAYSDNVLLKPEIGLVGVNLDDSDLAEYNELTDKIRECGGFSSFENAPFWFKRACGIRNDILFDSNRKIEKIKDILHNYDCKKVIIFTERIDTAEEITKEISKLGIECLCLHRKIKSSKIKEYVNRFSNTDSKIVLITAHLFEEGMSVPDVDMVILHSYNSTRRQAIQRIGRSLHNHIQHSKVFVLYYEDTKELYNAKNISKLFN